MSSGALIAIGSSFFGDAKSVEYYNADLDSWRIILDLDVDRNDFRSIMLNEKLMLVGGYNAGSSSQVQTYDFLTGIMTTVAPMTQPRYRHAIVVLARHLFAIGGYSDNSSLASVERYNPTTDEWTDILPVPTARYSMGVVVHDSEIYVIGGKGDEDYLSTVESYNPTLGSWKQCTPMNQIRSGLSVASIGNFIYAACGHDGFNYLNTVELYEPVIDRWINIEMSSIPRAYCASINYKNSFIVAGGMAMSTDHMPLVESYNVETNQWSEFASLTTGRALFSLVEVPWKYIPNEKK